MYIGCRVGNREEQEATDAFMGAIGGYMGAQASGKGMGICVLNVQELCEDAMGADHRIHWGKCSLVVGAAALA